MRIVRSMLFLFFEAIIRSAKKELPINLLIGDSNFSGRDQDNLKGVEEDLHAL